MSPHFGIDAGAPSLAPCASVLLPGQPVTRPHSADARRQRRATPSASGAVAALLSGVFVLSSGTAAAQQAETDAEGKIACAGAFEQAQRLRNDSRYVAANREVLKCATPSCGEALFQECTRLYDELQGAIPSVVFAAKDEEGNELADVSITVDGEPSVGHLDGKPVHVDPGSHTFGFSAEGYVAIERFAVIRTGEHFRPVMVVLEAKQAPKPPEAAAAPRASQAAARAPLSSSSRPARGRSVPVASWVLGGVGVLATAGFVGFRATGASQYDELQDSCKPHCSAESVDSVEQKYLLSSIALGVGAAAFAGAVTVYFIAPRESAPRTALELAPLDGGLATRWYTNF